MSGKEVNPDKLPEQKDELQGAVASAEPVETNDVQRVSFLKTIINQVGWARLIILAFFIALLVTASMKQLNVATLMTDAVGRFGMNAVLVLAMVPGIQCGIGLNFGVTLGIACGLLGGVLSVEWFWRLANINGIVFEPFLGALLSVGVAIIVGTLFAVVMGYLYGFLLNRVKGSEMTVSTYVGFSITAFMNIIWLILPFKSTEIRWPVGGSGARNVINLASSFGGVFSGFKSFELESLPLPPTVLLLFSVVFVVVGALLYRKSTHTSVKPSVLTSLLPKLVLTVGVVGLVWWVLLQLGLGKIRIPTGSILVIAFFCLLIWLFMRSRTGLAMTAAGSNPQYARANGISVDRMRIIGTVLSTVLGAIGIIVYAQAYGFLQLYNAPLMMGFACVAGVLIGGASVGRASVTNAIIGTFLFQGLLAVSLPVANALLPESNLADVFRIIVSNGIILYALTQAMSQNGGGKDA